MPNLSRKPKIRKIKDVEMYSCISKDVAALGKTREQAYNNWKISLEESQSLAILVEMESPARKMEIQKILH